MKINLKKKVMLALLAGGMLCANSAFADDYDPLEWYGLNDGSAKYTVTKPGYSSGATLTLDDSNYAAQSVVASAYGLRLFYGGYSETGEAKDNIVNITKLDNNPSAHKAYICGGYGAAANSNKVIVGVAGAPDAIVGEEFYRVYGGYATEKEANDNLVICYGKFDELRGASSFTEASRNTVNIENGIPIVNGNLSAAYINNSGTSGAAADDIQIKGNDNVLNIRKFANTSNLTNINVAEIMVLTGGGNGNLNVQANHNILNYYDDTSISRYIRAGNVSATDKSAASGIVYVESNNNEVNIYNITQTGGGLIAGNIYIVIDGDYGSCGEAHAVAKLNKVNIYGDVNISNSELYGASLDLEIWPEYDCGIGTVEGTDNEVNVIKGNFDDTEIYGAYVYADSGTGYNGDPCDGGTLTVTLDNNRVNISSGAFTDVTVYGAYGETGSWPEDGYATGDITMDLENNKVNFTDGNFKSGEIYGGYVYADYGYDTAGGEYNITIKNNTVDIKNGTFGSSGDVGIYGGYVSLEFDNVPGTESDTHVLVDNNTINIENGSFGTSTNNAKIYAGYVEILYDTSDGTVEPVISNNTINIKSGTFNSGTSIYGGWSEGSGTVSNNIVEISGGVFGSGCAIGGGCVASGEASYNKVNITGGVFTGVDIVGGYSNTGNAIGNELTISGGQFNDGYGLYGGYAPSGTSSGNTLNLKTVIACTALGVGGFQKINFTIPAGATSDTVMMRVDDTNAMDVSGITFTTALNGLALADGEYITLIKGVDDTGFVATDNFKILDIGGVKELVYTNGTPVVKADYTIKQGGVKGESGITGSYTGSICGNTDGADDGSGTPLNVTGGTLSDTRYSGNELIVRRGNYDFGENSEGFFGAITGSTGKLNVNNNTVEIFDATIVDLNDGATFIAGGENDSVGTDGDKGTASYNKVIIHNLAITDGGMITIVGGICPFASDNEGTTEGNSLKIENFSAGSANVMAAGALTYIGIAKDNTVELATGKYMMAVGGMTTATGDVIKNHVIIHGGDYELPAAMASVFPCTVAGGLGMGSASGNGKAEENTVLIESGNFKGNIAGGYLGTGVTGNATKNVVTIKGGTFGTGSKIYGGYSENGDANNNKVYFEGGSIPVESAILFIYGGYSDGAGTGNGNEIYILGDTELNNYLYVVAGRGITAAQGNNVYIGNEDATTVFNNLKFQQLVGGLLPSGVDSTGNVLHVRTAKCSVLIVGGFDTVNFTLPASIQNNDTILTDTTMLVVDQAGGTATINVKAANGVKLKAGDVITLVDVSNSGSIEDSFVAGDILGDAAMFYSETDAGEDKNGDSDTNDLVITLLRDFEQKKSAGSEDQQKAPVEGVAAAVQIVNQSADLASGEGMKSLVAETAGGFTNTFGAFTAGSSKYKTGSHVDVDGWGFLVGAGKTKEWKNGTATTYGLFFEYGKGDFDTYNGNVHGDGNSENKGIGIMARHKLTNNTYYEGNIRYGKQETEWSQSELGSYDTDSRYYGISVGVGHIYPVGKNEIDVYGRYTYGHVGACDATLKDSKYHFDSVKSHRMRVGAKYNFVQENSNAKPFIGLAWEHEFKGESKASISGVGEAPAPSMKGNTGIFEVGCDWNVSEKWTVGLGANAYMGKRKGWDGMARVFYNF